jgi:hypothetical protein
MSIRRHSTRTTRERSRADNRAPSDVCAPPPAHLPPRSGLSRAPRGDEVERDREHDDGSASSSEVAGWDRFSNRRLGAISRILRGAGEALGYRTPWGCDEALAYMLLETTRMECEHLLGERGAKPPAELSDAHLEVGMPGYLVSECLPAPERRELLGRARARYDRALRRGGARRRTTYKRLCGRLRRARCVLARASARQESSVTSRRALERAVVAIAIVRTLEERPLRA